MPPRLSLPRLPPPQIGSGRADGAGRLDWFWQSRLDLATDCTLVDQRKRRVHHCTESVQPENSLYRGRPAEPLEQSGEQPTVAVLMSMRTNGSKAGWPANPLMECGDGLTD